MKERRSLKEWEEILKKYCGEENNIYQHAYFYSFENGIGSFFRKDDPNNYVDIFLMNAPNNDFIMKKRTKDLCHEIDLTIEDLKSSNYEYYSHVKYLTYWYVTCTNYSSVKECELAIFHMIRNIWKKEGRDTIIRNIDDIYDLSLCGGYTVDVGRCNHFGFRSLKHNLEVNVFTLPEFSRDNKNRAILGIESLPFDKKYKKSNSFYICTSKYVSESKEMLEDLYGRSSETINFFAKDILDEIVGEGNYKLQCIATRPISA